MKKQFVDLDVVERCRQARQDVRRQYKNLDAYWTSLRQLEKKRAKNIAMANSLLAERDAERKGLASVTRRSTSKPSFVSGSSTRGVSAKTGKRQ